MQATQDPLVQCDAPIGQLVSVKHSTQVPLVSHCGVPGGQEAAVVHETAVIASIPGPEELPPDEDPPDDEPPDDEDPPDDEPPDDEAPDDEPPPLDDPELPLVPPPPSPEMVEPPPPQATMTTAETPRIAPRLRMVCLLPPHKHLHVRPTRSGAGFE